MTKKNILQIAIALAQDGEAYTDLLSADAEQLKRLPDLCASAEWDEAAAGWREMSFECRKIVERLRDARVSIMDVAADICDFVEACNDFELGARSIVGAAPCVYAIYSVRPFNHEHVDNRANRFAETIQNLIDDPVIGSVPDRFRKIIDAIEKEN